MLRTGPHHLAPMDKERGRSRLARSSPVPDLLEPSEGTGRISCDGKMGLGMCAAIAMARALARLEEAQGPKS
eukprot:8624969-Alexandrium_andersonii.AAC.1